ncbi:hypothetical protein AMTRI_Chr12g240020 [Amborella trichopoda]
MSIAVTPHPPPAHSSPHSLSNPHSLSFLLHQRPPLSIIHQLHAHTITSTNPQNPTSTSLYNSLLRAYSRSPSPLTTFSLYNYMLTNGTPLDHYTLPFVITACSFLSSLPHGLQLHGCAMKLGLFSDLYVQTTLLNMYASCSTMDCACQLFDRMEQRDLVSYNAMIAQLARAGLPKMALEIFREMVSNRLVNPDGATMVGVLLACAQVGSVKLGMWVHGYLAKIGGFDSNVVLSNALVDMYAKCGDAISARKVFDKMNTRDGVSWNTMISGYSKNGCFLETLDLFREMLRERVRVDEVTIVGVLSACSQLGALELGDWIHTYMEKHKLKYNVIVATSLIKMYAKCGNIDKAYEIFRGLPCKDALVWNAMIGAFAMHGHACKALSLFEEMHASDVRPTPVTFVGVLCACSHGGLVNEGRKYMHDMVNKHGIKPNIKHYGCIVDLLGRAGLLDEAQKLVESMPIEPDAVLLGALLSACKVHGNVELGEKVGKRVLELDPHNSGNYVLLSGIYARSGRWEDAAEVRKMMNDNGVKKQPGLSRIEVDNVVHVFSMADWSHPMSEDIYSKVDEMVERLKLAGHEPNTNVVLIDVEEDEKEQLLGLHSEKLALAFGLISVKDSQPIRIVKNLRVCDDCHSAIKLVSKIYSREIIVRDRLRFHHFREGQCSCGDYW